jgi:hypothetical protein
MLLAQMVAFHEVKAGNPELDWEDSAAFDTGDPTRGISARCVVVDGATEAFDSIRWAGQLVSSFVGVDDDPQPGIDRDALPEWFRQMQRRWRDESPTCTSPFEAERMRRQGSFATLLGCELHLDGGEPHWNAVALGDAVLFHVRGTILCTQFPALTQADFGLNPDGMSTQPVQLDRMIRSVRIKSGGLGAGDLLFLATDALAEWIVRETTAEGSGPWSMLAGIGHPVQFAAMVHQLRAAGAMKNDDVTLLRVRMTAREPDLLAVCR